MPIDKKPDDQVTQAGAVELDESALDTASAGLLPAVKTTVEPTASAPVATYHIQNAWPQKWSG